MLVLFFFFNDTATTEIYTLSLHDALPISGPYSAREGQPSPACFSCPLTLSASLSRPSSTATSLATIFCSAAAHSRSEEHTSELQSRQYLVCRLLLEKKKNRSISDTLQTCS